MVKATALKINVLLLSLLGASVVCVLAFKFGDAHPELVIAVASTLMGGFAAVMRDLIAPEPNPQVPESTVNKMLEVMQESGAK